MASFVRECVASHEPLARDKGIKLQVDGDDTGRVLIDPSKMSAVLDNLISNTIKYTYPGGEVRIRTELVGEEVVTHVEDTGQGLSRDDMKDVFLVTEASSPDPGGQLFLNLTRISSSPFS